MMARRFLPLVPALLLVAAPAGATYSVVATDSNTRQVGSAVTSCVGSNSVAGVFGSSPGHGGIDAQAAMNAAGRDRGVMLLNMDVAPTEIITSITAASFDSNAPARQYGIADLMGRAAGYTGARAQAYKEDRQGTIGTYTYSVQGNILTSKAVIDQTETAFRTKGCDLADKLMLALEGGAENGEGDSRCTGSKQIPSDSASIQVDLTGMPAGSYLRLSLSGTGTRNPLVALRTMFDGWRATHPCATGTAPDGGTAPDAGAGGRGGGGGTGGTGGTGGRGGSGGTGGGGGAGGAGTGGAAGSATGGAGGSVGAGGQGAAGTGGQGTAGTGGSPDAGAAGRGAGGQGSGDGPEDDGCGCHAANGGLAGTSTLFGVGLIALGLRLRRRR
jgi:uncharacterized Ntn-hydrolase superfamily protein